MDQNQNQRSLTHQFIKSQFPKRAVTKFILSVSVFSLFFSHTPLLSFVHYFNLYFSNLPFKLFSHTLDKNLTFLLCNGLLVFLAKYSGFFSSSSPSSSSSSSSSSSNKYNLNYLKSYEDDSLSKITIMETTHYHQVPTPLLQKETELDLNPKQKQNDMQHENEYRKRESVKAEAENSTGKNLEEQEEEEEDGAILEEDKSEAESRFLIEEAEDDDDDEEEEEEEEEEDGGKGKLSDEELNKKFDDFIRKMKEELTIEARQQLIMV